MKRQIHLKRCNNIFYIIFIFYLVLSGTYLSRQVRTDDKGQYYKHSTDHKIHDQFSPMGARDEREQRNDLQLYLDERLKGVPDFIYYSNIQRSTHNGE